MALYQRLMGSGKRPPRSVIYKLRKIQRKITRSDVKLTLQCYTHNVRRVTSS